MSWRDHATPRRVVGAAWLVFLIYAYPGYMQTDAADQLIEARGGVYLDWHPSIMTALWSVVEHVVSGPAGMLALQSGLFLWGTYLLLRHAMSARAAAFAAGGVLLFPPIMVTMALVSSEALLAGLLVLAAATLSSERRAARITGFLLVVFACGMHDAAIVAALPISIAWLRWREESGWRRLVIAFTAWIVAVVLSIGISRLLVDVTTQRDETTRAVREIVGMLRFAGTMSDAEIREVLADVPLAAIPNIQARAKQLYGSSKLYLSGDQRIFDDIETEAQRSGVIAGRRALVWRVPGTYLAYRWTKFSRLVGFSKTPAPIWTEFVEHEGHRKSLGHTASHSTVQSALIAPVRWLAETPLFRPYVYLISGLVLLVLAIVRKSGTAIALLASGVLYELAQFVFAERFELRDSHYLICATVLGIVLLVAEGIRRGARAAA